MRTVRTPAKEKWSLYTNHLTKQCSSARRHRRHHTRPYSVLRVKWTNQVHVTKGSRAQSWHQRLGQSSNETLKVSLPHVRGIDDGFVKETTICDACLIGKSTRVPRKMASVEHKVGAKELERVFSNVTGAMKYQLLVSLAPRDTIGLIQWIFASSVYSPQI